MKCSNSATRGEIIFIINIISEELFKQLQRDARKTQVHAFAEGTFDNLLMQWVIYLEFCVYFLLVALPASTAVLVWYVQCLSKKLKAHKSLTSYLSGVCTLHEVMQFPTRGFTGYILRLMLQGLRRTNTHVVRQALPLTPELLEKIGPWDLC